MSPAGFISIPIRALVHFHRIVPSQSRARWGSGMFVGLLHARFVQSLKSTAVVLVGLICAAPAAVAGNFVEPTIFASSRGVLDLLMIARAKPVTTVALPSPDGDVIHPTGWVYEICRRPANENVCPAGSAVADHGCVPLATQKGHVWQTRAVKPVPPVQSAHATHYRA